MSFDRSKDISLHLILLHSESLSYNFFYKSFIRPHLKYYSIEFGVRTSLPHRSGWRGIVGYIDVVKNGVYNILLGVFIVRCSVVQLSL